MATAQSSSTGLTYQTQATTSNFTYHDALQEIENGRAVLEVTEQFLSQLDRSERLSLLDGDEDFYTGFRNLFYDRFNRVPYVFGAIPRLGFPGVHFSDGPRGVVMGNSTAFPVAMARGATWDTALEQRVGQAIGREAKAQGANFYSGVCVNLPRHPAWGRTQEVYGEDPVLLGEFGMALTQGVQQHIMACVKHFALNSMENARFKVDVKVDEDVLHEVYLPHFRRIIEGGVASVMSSYNSVNGEWAGENKTLLTDILRKTWGFDGFVVSDFIWGLRNATASVKAGLDIETPFKQQRHTDLSDALESGELSWHFVDEICRRVLSKQLQFGKLLGNNKPDMSVVYCDEHRALAREVAARSVVLLKNEPVGGQPLLPLSADKINKIAVVGRLANIANTGDKGSSHVWSPHVVTAYEGVQTAFPHAQIMLEDTDSLDKARLAARDADIVICIVGYTDKDEGEYAAPTLMKDPALRATFPPAKTDEEQQVLAFLEGAGPRAKDRKGDSTKTEQSEDSWKAGAGGDRQSLRLRTEDVRLIKAVARENPRTIVSVVAGAAVIIEEWKDAVPAVLMSWYAGCEGGHGLMDVLTGRVSVGGRLPFSIPTDESHLPEFDVDAVSIKYDRWFGQSLLDKLNVQPAYPLGFGLSYTTFSTSNLVVGEIDESPKAETFVVRANVKNEGTYPSRFVAQVYGCPKLADFPARLLLGFQSLELAAGEEKEVDVVASIRPVQQWCEGRFVTRCEEIEVELARFAGDPDALRSRLHVRSRPRQRAHL